jgi:cation transport regulator ChaB
MTSHFSTVKESTQSDLPAYVPTSASNQAENFWKRMFNAWINTYELSRRSGAVPFLLL